jgi:hypothetical protein
MAQMIPDIDPATIDNNPGEQQMYIALRDQLPADWVVRHHYPACLLQGNRLAECEADFIVAAPGRGLMFIEVKSSRVYGCENGQWYRGNDDGVRHPAENPFFQASGVKHKLVERICEKIFKVKKNRFPGCYGHLVAYPRADFRTTPLLSQEIEVMLTRADMGRLKAKLEESFDLWDGAGLGSRFTATVMSQVIQFLKDECRLVITTNTDAEDDDQRLEELTQQQYQYFRRILESPRMLVQGPAGSGKTMIALYAARELAARGKKVLFLCFNKLLADWLRIQVGKTIEANSFHRLCSSRLNNFDQIINQSPNTKIFWANTAADLLFDSIAQNGDGVEKYDAIFVDEAQDYEDSWWSAIQFLLHEPDDGQLYLFADPNQLLYGLEKNYPKSVVGRGIYQLDTNCRNTKKIGHHCGQVIRKQIPSFDRAPEGVAPVVMDVLPSAQQRAAAIKHKINELLREDVPASAIAVLSPWAENNPESTLPLLDKTSNIPFITGKLNDWFDGKGIWKGTIISFKGLEAGYIFVVDIPAQISTSPQSPFTICDLYVASSRAKHGLYLMPSTAEAKTNLETIRMR